MTHPSVRIRAALLVFALCTAGLISGTVATTQSDAAFDYNGYIEKAAEAAKASKKQYGVPRAVTIAQSILESGWGRSGLSTKYKNYFGIKCSAVISPYQKGCVALSSYEYVKGKKKKYVSRFRVYSSMEKSFLDHDDCSTDSIATTPHSRTPTTPTTSFAKYTRPATPPTPTIRRR